MTVRLLAFKATIELGRGDGINKTYHSYQDPVSFLELYTSQIASGLWLISRVLKKLILRIFISILIAFMEE